MLFAPSLTLDLVSPLGFKTLVDLRLPDGSVRKESGRYYHVRLRNDKTWPRATQAQVFLVRIEEPGPNKAPQTRWSGDVPLKWQWHEIHPLQRTVGPEAVCDLCVVVKDKWLSIETLIQPQALDEFRIRRAGTPIDITVMLQARAAEGSSPITAFRISWDGHWDDGDAEMARRLIIEKVVAPKPSDISAP
jgi:hypothetical protein